MNKDKSIKDLKKRNDSLKMQYEYRNIRCITLENRIERYEQQIQELTNNWNELEEFVKFQRKVSLGLNNGYGVGLCDELLDKMKEIKENNK